uniref:Putative secreted peptide n=1 Tax=Anopheles braziliensis TaxID=58242 RepID=A0A2M3ZQF9_9DIPT
MVQPLSFCLIITVRCSVCGADHRGATNIDNPAGYTLQHLIAVCFFASTVAILDPFRYFPLYHIHMLISFIFAVPIPSTTQQCPE